MLTDEQVISVKRINDIYLKMISIVRFTYDNNDNMEELSKIFSNLYKISSLDEKIIYLLIVYIVNSEEDIIDILNETEALKDGVISEAINNGIKEFEISSEIVKDYLNNNCYIDINDVDTFTYIIDKIYNETKRNDEIDVKEENKSCVDYNLNHLESENVNGIKSRNKNLSKKIRRKILYEKY